MQIDEAAAALNTAINNLRAITTVQLDIDHTMIPKTKTAVLSVTAKDQLGVTMGLESAAIEYVSSNPAIASAADGVVTANRIGSADITVQATQPMAG